MKFLSGIPPIVDGLWNWNSKGYKNHGYPILKIQIGEKFGKDRKIP